MALEFGMRPAGGRDDVISAIVGLHWLEFKPFVSAIESQSDIYTWKSSLFQVAVIDHGRYNIELIAMSRIE